MKQLVTIRVREGEKNGYEIQYHDCLGLGICLREENKMHDVAHPHPNF